MTAIHPKLVTFDCAQTLVEVDWTVDRFALSCASDVGLDLQPGAGRLLAQMHAERLADYVALNRSKNRAACASYWRDLTSLWLGRLQVDQTWLDPMMDASSRLGFGPESILFRLYDDVIPCLDRLDALGVPAAVVSNWDYTLHLVLESYGLRERFKLVLASLEEGCEKPEPLIFQRALDTLGVRPCDALHVGDNPSDDYAGATAAGMRAALIDRSAPKSREPVLRSLHDLEEAFAWTG